MIAMQISIKTAGASKILEQVCFDLVKGAKEKLLKFKAPHPPRCSPPPPVAVEKGIPEEPKEVCCQLPWTPLMCSWNERLYSCVCARAHVLLASYVYLFRALKVSGKIELRHHSESEDITE